jgi:hypothetical protein
MTDKDIAALGPAFAAFLRRFRGCFRQGRTAAHFDSYQKSCGAGPRPRHEPGQGYAGAAVGTACVSRSCDGTGDSAT